MGGVVFGNVQWVEMVVMISSSFEIMQSLN